MAACIYEKRQVRRRYRLAPGLLVQIVLAWWITGQPAFSDKTTSEQQGGSDLRARLDSLTQAAHGLKLNAAKYDPEVFAINYPLLLLKIEKAKLLLEKNSYWLQTSSRAEWEVKEGEALTRLISANRVAYEKATGYQEYAYLSPADDSVQPYGVFVPRSYTLATSAQFPLMVFLHGYDTSLTKAEPWMLTDSMLGLFDQKNYLVAIPYGRKNTDFVSIGEVDVLTVIDKIKRRFRVDENRVYLMGVSMGGYGAYAITLHYPDLFAAITVVAGRTDHYFWQKLNREEVAPFKRWLIDADNPLSLVENARNVPILMMQGTEDSLVPTEHSRRMAAALSKLDYTFDFEELPGEDHWIYFGLHCYEAAVNWFNKYRRNPFPKLITHEAFSPKYGRAYWVEMKAFKQWGKPARIRAEVKPDNVIEVNTDNVARFSIRFPTSLLDLTRPASVVWNNKKVFEGDVRNQSDWDSPLQDPPGLCKSNPLWGPIKEAFDTPFLLVYGTGVNDATKSHLRNKARRMAEEWQKFADGAPTIKSDVEVNSEDIDGRNLILFGDARQNKIVARLQNKLPLQFREGEYRIESKTYRGEHLGFMMVYPNPLNPQRYVVVQTGLFWGDDLPINHKFDLLPDFIVYKRDTDPSDKTDRYLCAGFFDVNWKLEKSLIWSRSP